jgi:hypothetical protein
MSDSRYDRYARVQIENEPLAEAQQKVKVQKAA